MSPTPGDGAGPTRRFRLGAARRGRRREGLPGAPDDSTDRPAGPGPRTASGAASSGLFWTDEPAPDPDDAGRRYRRPTDDRRGPGARPVPGPGDPPTGPASATERPAGSADLLDDGHGEPGDGHGELDDGHEEPDDGHEGLDDGYEESDEYGWDGPDEQPPLPPLPPSSRDRRPRDPWIPEPPPLRTLSGPDIAGVVLLGALGIGVAVVLGLFVLNRFSERDPVAAPSPTAARPVSPSGTPSATPTPTSAPRPTPTASPTPTVPVVTGPPGRLRGIPYAGRLDPVRVTDIRASCVDDPSEDGNGDRVTYEPENAVDGDLGTTWRCPGQGIGETLTVTFDRPVTLGEIGIVNGYAKKDPRNGTDNYTRDRRVLRARWTLDGDRWVEERPDTGDRSLQSFRIPQATTRTVVVQIKASSAGRRNEVAISELTFGAVVPD